MIYEDKRFTSILNFYRSFSLKEQLSIIQALISETQVEPQPEKPKKEVVQTEEERLKASFELLNEVTAKHSVLAGQKIDLEKILEEQRKKNLTPERVTQLAKEADIQESFEDLLEMLD